MRLDLASKLHDGPVGEAGRNVAQPVSVLPIEHFGEIRPVLDARYLIKEVLSAAGLAVLFGAPGCGKSFVAIDMALHIACGIEWFGRRVRAGSVAYVAAEGQAGLRLRVEAWRRRFEISSPGTQFALIPASVDLLDPAADIRRMGETLETLASRWGRVDLIVIDTLAATFGAGDENSSDMAAYVANVARLAAPYRAAQLLIHHQPLNAEAKRPRGHGALWGAADTVLHVTGDREAPARRISAIKQKDCDPGRDILFRLKPVEIGFDDDGELVTSCVVDQVSEQVSEGVRSARRLSPRDHVAMSELERVVAENGQFPPLDIPESVLSRARTVRVAELSEWRAAFIAALGDSDSKPDSCRRKFDRSRECLQAAKIIGVFGDFVWFK